MNSWQDIVISIGSFVLIVALLPSVFGKNKPATATSLLTGSVLATFSFTFATLSLWLSAVFTAITGALWFILAIQKSKAK